MTEELGGDPSVGHIPVLVAPILELLAPQPGQTIVDLTAGRGGHALAIARLLGPDGTIVGVDLDADNLAFAERRVTTECRCRFVPIHGAFSSAPRQLADLGLSAHAVLADLGFASTQIEDPERGLSFSVEGPLDMRFDRSGGEVGSRTAADLLATLPEREITEMLRHLSEEPFAARIARAIVRRRDSGSPIETTTQLATLVSEVYGPRAARSRLHPATRTFMALRIAVNDELNRLSALLEAISEAAEAAARGVMVDDSSTDAADRLDRVNSSSPWLRPAARVAIISFHSLEDRLVKHAFLALERHGIAERLARKPIIASDAEVASNPRSRSAKLRAIRLGAGAPAPSSEERWRLRRERRGL